MKIQSKIFILAATVAGVMAAAPAQAQNPTYNPGDIVLYFQQRGGSNTVSLNLGTGFSYRDATSNIINIANIGTELSSVANGFGVNWFEADTLYMGIAGVRSTATPNLTHVNGDPNRTLYVSQNRTSLGTEGVSGSAGYAGFSVSDMQNGATGITQLVNRMEAGSLTTTLVETTSTSFIDEQNPFLGLNPGTAFSIFPGGVTQGFGAGQFGSFGGVNAEAAVDLYRILATTSATGQVGGPLREGSFEGSFVIDNTGNVSYIVQAVPEPSAAVLLGAGALLGGLVRRRKSVA